MLKVEDYLKLENQSRIMEKSVPRVKTHTQKKNCFRTFEVALNRVCLAQNTSIGFMTKTKNWG